MSGSIVVVVGATGNVGRHVVETLANLKKNSEGATPASTSIAAPATIRAVTRKASSDAAKALALRQEIEIHEGDVCVASSLRQALQGASAAFVALPQMLSSTEMVRVGKEIADELKAAGVGKVVRVSSLGIDKQGPLGDAHGEIERYMRDLGLKCTSVRPTSFFTNFSTYDLPCVTSSASFCSPLGTSTAVNWIHPRDIGRVSAFALTSDAWDEKELNITGPPSNTVTAPAMASLLSNILGNPISYSECEPPPIEDLQGLWKFLKGGGYDVSTDAVKTVTGEEGSSLEEWLRELLAPHVKPA